jgi:hypothetical protein
MTKGKGRTPGAGGLSKHIKSVAHRERAQPANRRALGPLEKHKDYKHRAAQRKQRVQRVQQLKRAAALRNADEFNVKMTKLAMDPATGKMRQLRPDEDGSGGKSGGGGADASLRDAVRSGRVNAQFLERKAGADVRRAQELSGVVGGLDLAAQNQMTVFVDSAAEVRSFRPERHFNTSKAMLSAPALRGSAETMARIRVTHALDNVDDAALLRRFTRGDFDWDEELAALRGGHPPTERGDAAGEAGAAAAAASPADGDSADAAPVVAGSASLQDTRTLRASLLGAAREASAVSQPVLLRMLRRAAVLEAQHNEKAARLQVTRAAREVTERVARAERLTRLAKSVRKRAAGQENRLAERHVSKFRPGVTRRTR